MSPSFSRNYVELSIVVHKLCVGDKAEFGNSRQFFVKGAPKFYQNAHTSPKMTKVLAQMTIKQSYKKFYHKRHSDLPMQQNLLLQFELYAKALVLTGFTL